MKRNYLNKVFTALVLVLGIYYTNSFAPDKQRDIRNDFKRRQQEFTTAKASNDQKKIVDIALHLVELTNDNIDLIDRNEVNALSESINAEIQKYPDLVVARIKELYEEKTAKRKKEISEHKSSENINFYDVLVNHKKKPIIKNEFPTLPDHIITQIYNLVLNSAQQQYVDYEKEYLTQYKIERKNIRRDYLELKTKSLSLQNLLTQQQYNEIIPLITTRLGELKERYVFELRKDIEKYKNEITTTNNVSEILKNLKLFKRTLFYTKDLPELGIHQELTNLIQMYDTKIRTLEPKNATFLLALNDLNGSLDILKEYL